jgi:hypothetical protein
MVDGKFTCSHPLCEEEEHTWTTQNGYKYHLNWVCWRNPKAKKRAAMRAGLLFKDVPKGKPKFECECGQTFRSKNGYTGHRHTNESTRDGKCLIKAQKRMAAQSRTTKEEDNGTREPENLDWLNKVFNVDSHSKQDPVPQPDITPDYVARDYVSMGG